MKSTKIRNTVKVNSKGNYLMTGLSKNEKESLRSTREDFSRYVGESVVDQYIIAYYCKERNEIYFAGERYMTRDEKAILV